MGAVIAILTYQGSPAAETAERMLRAAPHRGAQRKVEVAGPCAIGICHRDDEADASLVAWGGWGAAFVGNLDNRQALRDELRGHGAQAPDESVAGAALAAFRAWGEPAIARFRGAYAGVIWDGEQLWCFRDHVGFRPLFYRSDARGFYCATEAKQIVAGAGMAREPDLDALSAIYYRGTAQDAAIKGIKRLFSATIVRVERGGRVVTTRYWRPSTILESARIGPAEARERLLELLAQAVRRTVTGRDVIELSGGIDSPTVAAFAAAEHLRVGGAPLRAINTSYPDFPSVDEAAYARQVAEHLGIPLHSNVFTGSPLDDIEHWAGLADGPWDTFPMSLASQNYRLARDLGGRTVLTGELAEFVYTVSHSLLGHLVWHGRWRALARYTKALRHQGVSWPSVGRRVAMEAVPGFVAGAYLRLARRRSGYTPDWIDITAVGGSPYRRDLAGSPRQRWRRAQLSATWGTTTTMEADELCAAVAGVVVRRPLADVDLWEFFLSLPAEVKFPDPVPKSLIRRALRGRLPDAILDRRTKTVFNAYMLGTADYPAMRHWIDPSEYRMPGVDYTLLQSRIERRQMGLLDLPWAYNLVRVHAFLRSLR